VRGGLLPRPRMGQRDEATDWADRRRTGRGQDAAGRVTKIPRLGETRRRARRP